MKLLSRSARTVAVMVALAGLVASPACKKDEPKAPEGTTPAAEAGKAEAGKAEAGAAEAGKAAPAATKELVAAATAKAMETPDSVVVVAGVPSLKEVITTIGGIANKIAPGQVPPDMASMAMEGLKQGFGLTDISWLKQDAPVRMAMVDPKANAGKGQVFVVPMTDKDAVLKSLKPEAERDVEGHAAKFEHQFQTWYVDFVEGHVVLTDHPEVFGKVKDFVGGALLGWRPERLISAQVQMDNVNRLYGQEIAEGRRTFTQMAGQMAANPDMPDMGKILEAEMDMLFGALEATKRLDIGFWSDGGDIKLGFGFLAKDGSGLQGFAKTIAGKTSTLTSAAPPSSWMGFAMNLDMRKIESLKRLSKLSVESYSKLLKLTEAEQARLGELMDQMYTYSAGDGVTAVYTEGSFPLAILSVAKVTSGPDIRKAYGELLDLLFAKGWALAKEEMAKEGGAMPPGAEDIKSLPDLVKFAGAMVGPMGVELATISEERDGVQVDALTVKVDWDKIPDVKNDPAAYDIVTKVVGPTLQVAFGFKGDTVAMTFGPNAVAKAVSLANGKLDGGSRSLTAASRGAAFAMTVDVPAAMKAMTFIPDLAPMKDRIASMPSDRPFTVQGASDGSAITFTVGVPVDVLQGLASLAQ